MTVLYLGSFFEESRIKEIWDNSKGALVNSANIFQRALLDGFVQNNFQIDCIVNAPAIGSYPYRYRKIWFSSSLFLIKNIKGINAGFFNFMLLKNICVYTSVKKHALSWAKKEDVEDKIIIVYSLLSPYLQAALAVKKLYPNTKICCIVLDLPEFFNDKISWIYSILNKIETHYIYNKLLPYVDSYILLTKYMVEALHIRNKPWLLMEGIYSFKDRRTIIKEEFTVLYTGLLDRRYGVADLLNAFCMISDERYKLWICGDGTDRYLVEDAAKKDRRIVYYGYQKQDRVLMMQQQATILINPRNADGEFTKYSFPSKTMEYMASGTPTIMYKLPGVPDEYLNYLAIIPDDSLTSLKETIIEWCNKPIDELNRFGGNAKKFIEMNKTATIQSRRIINFIINN
jgi:glycosyltransferase involved in cell wall biosynthesis